MRNWIFWVLAVLFVRASFSYADVTAKVPADLRVQMERTECFGTCPAYKLTVSADGTVAFDGDKYVTGIGRHVKTVPPENVARMWDALESARFFQLNGDYSCRDMTDMPSAIVTVTADGKTKEIVHYHGCSSAPARELYALQKLEDTIDRLADVAGWLKYDRDEAGP